MATEDRLLKLDKLLVSSLSFMFQLMAYDTDTDIDYLCFLADGVINILAFHVNETNNMTFLPGKHILWLGRLKKVLQPEGASVLSAFFQEIRKF